MADAQARCRALEEELQASRAAAASSTAAAQAAQQELSKAQAAQQARGKQAQDVMGARENAHACATCECCSPRVYRCAVSLVRAPQGQASTCGKAAHTTSRFESFKPSPFQCHAAMRPIIIVHSASREELPSRATDIAA